jgi:exodeoxyribonuclease-3
MAGQKLKLLSWNVNGIRSCIQKGFWEWFDAQGADVVCLQETKITDADFARLAANHSLIPIVPHSHELPLDEKPLSKRRHDVHYAIACAEKAGYSGVGILSKTKPLDLEIGLGNPAYDREGRVIIAHYEEFTIVNAYFPNGQRDLKRIPYKLEFSDYLLERLQKLRKKRPNIAICGDMNVAHAEIDIKNPKSNANNSGFTPIEREWFTKFLSKGYVDTFRRLHPSMRDAYSWWSYRPGVRQKNVGWRIDYFVVTEEFAKHVKGADIQCDVMGSDHCPVSLDVSF